MKMVAFEISLKELLVFSMRNGNELIINRMWGNEEKRKYTSWFSWVRVNQRESMEYKTGKGLEQMWLVIDCRKERICGFFHESVSCSVVSSSLGPHVL